MRLMVTLSIALVLSLASTGSAAEPGVVSKAVPIATTPVDVVTTAPLTSDSNVAATATVQTVSRSTDGNVCPQCGRVHGTPARRAPVARRPSRQYNGNMFGRVMELERRKNIWLRSMFR